MVAFNPFDPAFLANPYPFYAMGQRMSPLYIEGGNIWAVFGYDECLAILKNQEGWSSYYAPPPGVEAPPSSMLDSDPPRHARLRGLVSQAFTPRMVAELEPRAYEVAHELVDAIAGQPEIDLVEALAYPLPVIMIAEILGVPAEDRANFKRWSDAVVAQLGAGVNGQQREVDEELWGEIREYFAWMTEERRREPRNDLISGLVVAELEGSKLNFEELVQMLVLLLVAGNETTTNLIGNAVQEFMEHPAELARLRGDMSLLPSAIEEVLRHSSPVQATVRRSTRDQEFAGRQFKQDQQALIFLAAANRDARVFEDPERFDIGRVQNRHLGFGMGIHFCLGAPLARLEAKAALDVFLARATSFARTDERELRRVPTFIMRGVRELPLAVEWA